MNETKLFGSTDFIYLRTFLTYPHTHTHTHTVGADGERVMCLQGMF